MLGSWGTAAYQFYDHNSLWINLIVLAYGAWIVISWINLKNIRAILIHAMMDQLQSQADLPSAEPGQNGSRALIVPWETAVKQSRFPYIAYQFTLVPRRLTVKTVQSMLPVEELTSDARRIFKLRSKKKPQTI